MDAGERDAEGSSRLRASDADRQRTIDLLAQHLGDGRLGIAEYGRRVERALAAATLPELYELTSDLPYADAVVPSGRARRWRLWGRGR